MLINDLEKKTGLTRHTIRFYEKEGLLRNYIHRGENNYRDYSEEAVTVLLNIKILQATGITLAELKEVIGADERHEVTYEMKIAYVRQKMAEIDQRKAELDRIQSYLASLIPVFYAEKDQSVHCYNCILPEFDKTPDCMK